MAKAQVTVSTSALIKSVADRFEVKKRAARIGRNPQTGESIKIPAGKKIAFRASKSLKEIVSAKKKSSKKR